MITNHPGVLNVHADIMQIGSEDLQIVALQQGGYFAVWHEATGDFLDIFGQRYDENGFAVGPPVRLNAYVADNQRNAVVVQLADGSLAVAWQSFGQEPGFWQDNGFAIVTNRFTIDGEPLGVEQIVNDGHAADQIQTRIVALPDGGYVVNFRSTNYTVDPDILFQRYGADGGRIGDNFELEGLGDTSVVINSFTVTPDGTLVLAHGRFLLPEGEWRQTLSQFAPDGSLVVPDAELFWEDFSLGFPPDFRVFVSPAGDFIAIGMLTVGDDFYFQRLDETGQRIGSTVILDLPRYSSLSNPRLDFLPDGTMVLTYQRLGESGSLMLHLSADFQVIAGPFDVAYGQQWEYLAAPTVLENGDLVLQWRDEPLIQGDHLSFSQVYHWDEAGDPAGFSDAADIAALGAGDQNITALGGNDTVSGEDGNDTIWGEDGHDDLTGGAGNDVLDGGDGWDNLQGGAEDDRIYGQRGADTLDGGDGNDVLIGGEGNDLLMGGAGQDFLDADGGNDSLFGGDGDDTLLGSDHQQTEYDGGDGNDLLLGSMIAEMMVGGEGNDTIIGARSTSDQGTYVDPADFDDTVLAGPGDDVIHAHGQIDAGAGNDTIAVANGHLDGGPGQDVLRYFALPDRYFGAYVYIDLLAGTLRVEYGPSVSATIENIEHVDGRGTGGRYYVQGDFGDNVLIGSGYSGELRGLGGDDYLEGIGGLYGGPGQDTLVGNGYEDRLVGGAGDDVLISFVSDAAVVKASYPGQRFDGGDGFDVVILQAGPTYSPITGLEIDLGAQTLAEIGLGYADPTLISIEGVLYEGHLPILAAGSDGDDLLGGGSGDDTFLGGAGADTYLGGDGVDIVDYSGATRSVRVDLQNPDVSYNDAAGDRFESIEIFQTGTTIDQLRGDAGDNEFYAGGLSDRLYGRAGDDLLFGEAGADAFYGGLGADTMTGGDDAGRRDRYIYFSAAETGVGEGNRDVITDFVSGEDRIELRRIDADLTEALKQGFEFIGEAAFSAAGQLRYEHVGGNTIVQADRDGDGAADFEIELTGTIALTDSDFLI